MPSDSKIIGYETAVEQASKRMSPRAHRLAALERWVDGTQYGGMADWFDDVPISEKAPCIVEPIVADAIESHVDMVLGEGKFPAITSRPAEDESEDEEGDAEDGLDEKDSAALDKLISGVAEQARFRALCREALSMAMGCGSSGVIYGARAGKLCGNTVKARWCTPTFGEDGRTVTELIIEYPYVDSYLEHGEWKARAMVFRRVIDDKSDTTYKPAPAELNTVDWKSGVESTIEHGLGFCPVVWYPFFRGCTIVGQVDGNAIHQSLLDEIRAHDVAVSQRHRAALYAGDPQWTETGVEPGENPSQAVQAENPVHVTRTGGPPTADNPVIGTYRSPVPTGGARKKHPGTVWQYSNEKAVVELHQLNGDALKAVSDNGSDIRLKLMQALAYVPLDPESSRVLRGSLSGKALDSLRERQLNRDDRIRDDFGDCFMKPSVSMLLRISQIKAPGLRVRGLKAAKPILDRFVTEDTVNAAWLEPSLSLRWGSYSKLDGDEQVKIVQATIQAKKEGICTTRQAVEKVAPIFGTENVDAVLQALEEEAADRAAKALEQTKAEQQSLHDLTNDGAGAAGGRGKEKPQGTSGSGGGGASAADAGAD